MNPVSATRVLALLLIGIVSACSAADAPSGSRVGQGGAAVAGSSGMSGAGAAGEGAISMPLAGSTGAGVAGSAGSAGFAGQSGGDSCAGISAQAEARKLPTDVIWAIDTSGSMTASFPAIQQALTDFSSQVTAAGVDAHIILLAGSGLCVPAPLGSGACGAAAIANGSAADSREPAFLHLDTPFGLNQGMGVLLDNYAAYQHLLREGARTQLVLTEDGAPPMMSQAVVDHVEGRASATLTPAWSPGLPAGSYVWNGVICTGTPGPNGAFGTCGFALAPPATVVELIAQTGGVQSNLANADGGSDPFAELLDALAQNVIVGATLSCTYDIPSAPSGMSFDADKVNVVYATGSGATLTLPRVADDQPCEDDEGWKYDVASAPTKVELCPAACTRVQGDVGARIDVQFGCETVVLAPD